jgi:hypothetical protein
MLSELSDWMKETLPEMTRPLNRILPRMIKICSLENEELKYIEFEKKQVLLYNNTFLNLIFFLLYGS